MRMRLVSLLLTLSALAGCELYFSSSQKGPPDAPSSCSGAPPGANCTCTDTIGWACNDCPFDEGAGPVACTAPASCSLETWEHGCSCSCTADGWWSCFDETIGTHCPQPPTGDAGVIVDAPPDAVPIDAAPCSPIEAESLGPHAGWGIAVGDVLQGGEALEAGGGNPPFVFHFVGTGLVVYDEQGPSMGKFSITVDTHPPVVVDANRGGDFTFQNPTTVAAGLANQEHAAIVTCLTLDCQLDYFDVTCP